MKLAPSPGEEVTAKRATGSVRGSCAFKSCPCNEREARRPRRGPSRTAATTPRTIFSSGARTHSRPFRRSHRHRLRTKARTTGVGAPGKKPAAFEEPFASPRLYSFRAVTRRSAERGGALFQESSHALGEVRRQTQFALQVALEIELLVETVDGGGVDPLFDRRQGLRRRIAKSAAERVRFLHQRGVVDGLPDQTPLLGARGVQRFGQHREPARSRRPDQAREKISPAEVRHQPDPGESLQEARRARGEHDVAGEGEIGARAGRDPIDRAYDRNRQGPHQAHDRIGQLAERVAEVARRRPRRQQPFAEVLPGAESASRPGQQHRAAVGVAARLLERRLQLKQQRLHERVEPLRPVETKDAIARMRPDFLNFDDDWLFFHGAHLLTKPT